MIVIILNMICLVTQVMFVGVELLQLKYKGVSYFYDVWNWLDMTILVVYVIYFFKRISDPGTLITPIGNPTMGAIPMTGWVLMNTLLLITAILKMMFFLRVYESFGLLITLVQTVIKDMSIFLLFFVSWILIFSLIFRIVGVDVAPGDYSSVNPFVFYII
jgi:hypothetical protein